MGLNVGDRVPIFSATSDSGVEFISSDIIGKKPVVIYFYPKNFTPGCIKEACSFRDNYEDFKSLGAEVIGISSDRVRSHVRFKERYQLPFIFLSDKDNVLQKLFGVESELFGLLPGRETYVVNKEGVVCMKFNNRSASKHMDTALTTLKKITQKK